MFIEVIAFPVAFSLKSILSLPREGIFREKINRKFSRNCGEWESKKVVTYKNKSGPSR